MKIEKESWKQVANVVSFIIAFGIASFVVKMCTKSKIVCLIVFVCCTSVALGQDAKEFVFPEQIESFLLNSDSSFLAVTMAKRDKKNKIDMKSVRYGIFRLDQQRLSFVTTPLDVKHGGGMAVLSNGVLIGLPVRERDIFSKKTTGMYYTHYDVNGIVLWELPFANAFVQKSEVDLGVYVNNLQAPHQLNAIRLSDGKSLWTKEISSTFLNKLHVIYGVNDSTVLIAADKIYKWGRKNGSHDSVKYKSSTNGVPVSFFVDGHHYYASDSQSLICLNDSMQVLWTSSHPSVGINDIVGVLDDSTRIQLVNYGYIFNDGILFPITYLNKPYIATYDKQSGKQISLDYINWKKSDGRIVRIRATADDVYILQNKDTAFSKLELDKGGYMVTVDKGDAYLLDQQMTVKKKFMDEMVYRRIFEIGDMICVGRFCPDGNDFYLIDRQGTVVRHLPEGIRNIVKAGQYVYYAIGNKLYLFNSSLRNFGV
jgi:hypothetical protein